MIRPYLRDLINDHKPTVELNNEANDSDTERGERRVQLLMVLLKILKKLTLYIQ